ncbi:OLC1v1034812C1 [Oldenlandia corymbosa var. corymbosa]|uniref:OLC1v1034812C1 n=1 Tax=Oldenlandia corymbosa var. corymbosa TaxID=529605 RepID=A0AAV1CUI2_OLDCO|nr:OLC1v1034812C1 [Oldenlandia corymbosa var. corymbosa]
MTITAIAAATPPRPPYSGTPCTAVSVAQPPRPGQSTPIPHLMLLHHPPPLSLPHYCSRPIHPSSAPPLPLALRHLSTTDFASPATFVRN